MALSFGNLDWAHYAPKCINTVKDAAGNNESVATLSCLPGVFHNVVNSVLIIAGITAVVLIVLSGLRIIKSSGDVKQFEEARKGLTYAILGLVIILSSFLIINGLAFITGATCINNFGFDTCR